MIRNLLEVRTLSSTVPFSPVEVKVSIQFLCISISVMCTRTGTERVYCGLLSHVSERGLHTALQTLSDLSLPLSLQQHQCSMLKKGCNVSAHSIVLERGRHFGSRACCCMYMRRGCANLTQSNCKCMRGMTDFKSFQCTVGTSQSSETLLIHSYSSSEQFKVVGA